MSKGSILLVDDDLHILKSTAHWLRDQGFAVSEASSIHTAQDAISNADLDLVISDIRLEDGDGFTLLKSVQKVINNGA